VIFKEEDVGGLNMVTTDEDRVIRGGLDRDQITYFNVPISDIMSGVS